MIKSLFALMFSFGKIGLIALGGGNSMLKLLEYESVQYRHWVGQDEFVQMLGSTFLFPGLTAVKLSALIGYKVSGVAGLLIAVLCLNLPGLLLAVSGYVLLKSYQGPVAQKLMLIVQYGALALLAAAVYSIAQSTMTMYYSLPIILLSLLFLFGLIYWQISPFWGFLAFIGICFVFAP